MVTELNNRDIGGGMHHAIQIQQEICSLYNELKEMQLQASSILPSNTDDAVTNNNNSGNGPVPIKLYNYAGQFCILPPKFEIPSVALSPFISFYLIGDRNNDYPPFRLVKSSQVKNRHSHL